MPAGLVCAAMAAFAILLGTVGVRGLYRRALT
jgi:hypothetical protein